MIPQQPFIDFCNQRKNANQFRTLATSDILPAGRVKRGEIEFINFASNDYLDLSHHPQLIARAQECAAKYGTGSTASRHITGNQSLYADIETKLAKGKGTEAALVFASGYQANMTVLAAIADSTIMGNPVAILADRLIHNSLLQGAMLATANGNTNLRRFHHNDYAHLEKLLEHQSEQNAQSIIVTESVFGMDGDRADLAKLTDLADRFNAMLYVDEAHATGIYGANGFGLCADYKGRIDIAMGTFGKALGSFGAYIACSTVMRDFLIQRCGGLIYSTALPPTVLGSIDAALNLLQTMKDERAAFIATAEYVRDTLLNQGWNCGTSTTHIIPIILGDENTATNLSEHLRQKGLLIPTIRPPTVPKGTSRLRISLSAAHSTQDIDQLLTVLGELRSHHLQAA